MVYNFDLKKNHRSRLSYRSRKSAIELSGILQDILDAEQ